MSIVLDGSLESHSAAMMDSYADADSAGSPAIEPDDLNRIVRLLDADGWQLMTHATGDRAVNMALTAYEHAVRSNRLPDRGRRHRIEGVEAIDAAARAFAEARGLKLGKVAQPLRAALTGRTVSPGIFEVMVLIGREESLARLGDQIGS